MEGQMKPSLQSHIIPSSDTEALFKHLHPELVTFLKTCLSRGDTFITGSRVIELVYPMMLSAFYAADPAFNDLMMVTHQWGKGTKALIDSIREFSSHECRITIPQPGSFQRFCGKNSIFGVEILMKGSANPSIILSVSVNSLRDISRCLVRVESIFFDGENVRIFNPDDLSLHNSEPIVRTDQAQELSDEKIKKIREMLIGAGDDIPQEEYADIMGKIVALAGALVKAGA